MPTGTVAEKEKARQTRTERELQALGEGTKPSRPRPVRTPPKKPAAEAIGVGRNQAQENFNRLSAGLRKKIAAARASGNNTLAKKLEVRHAELKKITEGAK